jgi:hypothetical protein
METMPPDHDAAPFDPMDRVAALLGAVRAVLASLESLSGQLEHELRTLPVPEDALESLRTENRQLKEALEGRALIERAKGMLMTRHGCDEATAFQMLVSLSRSQHRKVRAVAADFAGAT